MISVLEAALTYARRGWHVLPLWEIGPDGSCACGQEGCHSPGKHPRLADGHKGASADEARVRDWWAAWPTANVGIALDPSGLVVLDVDVVNDKPGLESFVALEKELGGLPETLAVKTGSNGLHFYYSATPGLKRRIGFRPGLDLLVNGFVVAPPSNHVKGTYRVVLDRPVLPLPAGVAEVANLRDSRMPNTKTVDTSSKLVVGDAAIIGKTDNSELSENPIIGDAVPEGGRNDHLFSLAGTMRSRGMVDDAILAALLAENRARCRPPLDEREVEALVRSVQRYAPAEDALPAFAAAFPDLFDLNTTGDDLYGVSVRDLLGEDDPGEDEEAWIVRGVLATAVPQVIAGPPKSRKTFIAEHLAICIAAGIPWLGKFPVRRGRVLILPLEDSRRETRRRIWRLARGLGLDPRILADYLFVETQQPFRFDVPADVDRMDRTIARMEPSLVVVDSLSRTHRGDENSVKEMQVVTATWGALCQRHEVAFAIIHHLTKVAEGPLLRRLRGTGDLGALVRHIVGVTKHDNETSELEFDGNLPNMEEPFLIKFADGEVNGKKVITLKHAGLSADERTQRADEDILKALAAVSPKGLTATVLRKAAGVKGTFADARVAYLVERGKVYLKDDRFHFSGPPAAPIADFLDGLPDGGETG